MDLATKSGGITISIIGTVLVAINRTFININLRGFGVTLVLIGVLVFLSQM